MHGQWTHGNMYMKLIEQRNACVSAFTNMAPSRPENNIRWTR